MFAVGSSTCSVWGAVQTVMSSPLARAMAMGTLGNVSV
jgi:hypothetical protein